MQGGGLSAGDIVMISIPDSVPHPALVILDLRAGGYVLVNGTGTREDNETPVVVLAKAAARRCGLGSDSKEAKETYFYGSRKFIWYWRNAGELVQPIGNMLGFPTYRAGIRAAAVKTLKAMRSVSAEIQKLPDGAGMSLEHLKTLKDVLRSE